MPHSRAALLAAVVLSLDVHAQVAIKAVCANSPDCNVNGTLTLRAVNDRNLEIVRPIVHGVANVALDERGRDWEIELAADGFWMPRQLLKERVDVWRTTKLAGRFMPSEKAELPKSFEISAQSTFGSRSPAVAERAAIDCPIAADGSWSCAVPATRLDLTFRVKGFTPEYRWDVKLQPGTPKSVGNVALRRGASIVAWLDRETLKQLKTPARARLIRMAMAAPSLVSMKLNEPVAVGAFSERGVVQLAPIPAGSYSLEVSAPGFATATIPQIEVYEGKESTLRHTIRLEPPISIHLSLDPPRDPWGKPWHVSLSRVAELGVQAVLAGKGEVDETGSFTADGQSPGKFSLSINDSRDNRFAHRQLTIHSDADAHIAVDLATLRVSGRVTMGERAVAATLLFGGNSSPEKVRAEANGEGEFSVVLPRAGVWNVDVREDAEAIRAAVDVTVKDGEPVAIELPDTEIAGWVVSPDGSRVGTARVNVITNAGWLDRDVDANGNFRLRGVSAGKVHIDARDLKTGEFSRSTEIAVEEGTHTTNVQIELQGLATFRGTLLSQAQPVAGALITAYGLTGGPAKMLRTVTGLEGEFELAFPTTANRILLIAASPGRTLQAYTLTPTDHPARLELAPVGGTVRIAWPKGAKRAVLVYNGTDIPMNDVGSWLQAHGREFGSDMEIPAMAPGPYRFCADTADGRTCRDGLLARGGTLSLTID